MINEDIFWRLQRSLAAEFSKYILIRPEVDEKIPDNAQIVFHIKGQSDFNKWSDEINRKQKEVDQITVVIEVEGLAPSSPQESRLINPHLLPA